MHFAGWLSSFHRAAACWLAMTTKQYETLSERRIAGSCTTAGNLQRTGRRITLHFGMGKVFLSPFTEADPMALSNSVGSVAITCKTRSGFTPWVESWESTETSYAMVWQRSLGSSDGRRSRAT